MPDRVRGMFRKDGFEDNPIFQQQMAFRLDQQYSDAVSATNAL